MSDLGTRLDWVGAVWLTLLAFHWLIRWRTGIPGRYISVSGWLIIISAILTLRWPRILGFNTPLEIEYSTRFITYIISTWLQIYDWIIFKGLTDDEKAQIQAATALLKRKKKAKKDFVKREDYDILVRQLETIETLKREEGAKKNDEL